MPPRLLIIVKELYKSESESIIDNLLLSFELYTKMKTFSLWEETYKLDR